MRQTTHTTKAMMKKSANVPPFRGGDTLAHIPLSVLTGMERLALLCSSSSGTHSGTGHLHGANDYFLRSNDFETFERQVTHLDALAKTQLGYINFQLFRNFIVASLYGELTNHRHQLTTGTYTLCQTNRLNRDSYLNGLIFYYLIKVHVQDIVLYRVELSFLHNRLVLNTVNVHNYEVDVRSVNHLVDFLFIYNEMNSFGIAVGILLLSVKYARYIAILTNFLRSLLAEVGTQSTINYNLLHAFNKLCYSKLSYFA